VCGVTVAVEGAPAWAGRELDMRQDGFASRTSTLWDGPRAVARFRVEGFFGQRAALELGSLTWHYQWVSFWGRRRVISEGARPVEIFYDPGWWGRGTAVSAAGDLELRWRQIRFWRNTWAWVRGDEPMIQFERRGLLATRGFHLSIDPEARRWVELPGVIGLGWLLLLQHRHHGGH
jgi:hypothetical protein